MNQKKALFVLVFIALLASLVTNPGRAQANPEKLQANQCTATATPIYLANPGGLYVKDNWILYIPISNQYYSSITSIIFLGTIDMTSLTGAVQGSDDHSISLWISSLIAWPAIATGGWATFTNGSNWTVYYNC